MIVVAIVIQEVGDVVKSEITSKSVLPSYAELKALTRFHKLFTEGAAKMAADDKHTMTIVDQSMMMSRGKPNE